MFSEPGRVPGSRLIATAFVGLVPSDVDPAVPDDTVVLFSVRDQGRGVPENRLEVIFERFEQVDSSDAREKGGTGLGLSISRSIVERLGGRIWAVNNPDRGSTFAFTLPEGAAEIPEESGA